MKGIVATTAALSLVLEEGIGDYDSRVTYAESRRRPHRGSARRAAGAAIAGASELHAPGYGMPGLRPHDEHVLSEDGRGYPRLFARTNAVMARASPRRGRNESRGDGMRCKWPRRIEACEHRNFASWNGRRSQSPGLRRWRAASHTQRRRNRRPDFSRFSTSMSKRGTQPARSSQVA